MPLFDFLKGKIAKAEERAADSKSKSPSLQFEQFSKEWQQLVGQDNFDGFRMEAGKSITPNLQASHSLILGTALRESGYLYQFGPTFQSADGKSFITARAGIDGVINGRLGFKPSANSDVKLNISSSIKEAQRNAFEAEIGLLAQSSAQSLKIVHQGTWILNGSYSREITDNLWLGTDLTYIPMNGVSLINYGARYVSGPHAVSANLGQQPDFKSRNPLDSSTSLKCQYVKKISDRLSLGVELETNFPERDSSMKLGYDYTFRQARVQGLLDSSGKVSCFVSDMTGFGVSGMIDYIKGDYKFGFMMHVVPQPESTI